MISKDKEQHRPSLFEKSFSSGSLAKNKKTELSFLFKELIDDKNFFLVCHALFHDELEVSIGAALALGHMKDKRALPYLTRALLTTDQKRAQAFMWALGEIRDDRAIPFLLSALRANFVQKSAILALGKIGSIKTLDAIFIKLDDDDESIRALAAKALNQIQFEADERLISETKKNLKAKLGLEPSRRVKLLMAVLKKKLENLVQ